MSAVDPSYRMPGMPRAKTLTEARRNGRHAIELYGHALREYPNTAIFNTSDIRVLVSVIDDLTRSWKGRP
jgi:hypothetical protein